MPADLRHRPVEISEGRTGAHHHQRERHEGDQEPEGVVGRDLQGGVHGTRPFGDDRVERRQVDEPGYMRADPGGGGDPGGGVAQVPANRDDAPVADGLERRARAG